MQHQEKEFGVALFVHGKNCLALNETGEKAVEYASTLLSEAEKVVAQVRQFDWGLHIILVESCAPAPLWSLLPALSEQFPDKTISSRLTEISLILSRVKDKTCEIGILPYPTEDEAVASVPFIREELSVSLPPDHALAGCSSVTLEMLNGYNCLLKSDIGFWSDLCHNTMPASRFLVQTDEFEFRELARASTLPYFVTNLASDADFVKGRTVIPVSDAEANVTFHMIFRKENQEYQKTTQQLARRSPIQLS
ncbi:MAG: LysR family transcriptional regulator substrate-binding protein [Clostridiales bacterium]|nr:LysR family transcriptional regulator substrate-binding protein [Clostridiales bacterium]